MKFYILNADEKELERIREKRLANPCLKGTRT